MTVLPGFVRTSALADMKTPGLLTAEPEEVAAGIRKAEAKGGECIYVRPAWAGDGLIRSFAACPTR